MSSKSNPQESSFDRYADSRSSGALEGGEKHRSQLSSSNDHQGNDPSHPPENADMVCNACGFESEYVPEGMLKCERCQAAYYCSLECLQWDWKSGGHADSCIDIRPEPDLDSEPSQDIYGGGGGDDMTLVSMDIGHVFSSNASVSGPGVAPKSNSSVNMKEKQKLWEDKMKTAAASNDKPKSESAAKSSSGAKLGTFFQSQAKSNPPESSYRPPAPLQTPQKSVVEDVIEEDEEESFELLEVEEEVEIVEEDPDTALHSIVEESSSHGTPVEEGSWRSRQTFNVSISGNRDTPRTADEGLQRSDSAKEIIEEEEEIIEEEYIEEEIVDDSQENLLAVAPVSGVKRGTEASALAYVAAEPQMSVKRLKEDEPAGHPTATSESTKETVEASNQGSAHFDDVSMTSEEGEGRVRATRRSSLKDFRAIYSDQAATDGQPTNSRSLKDFRDAYTADAVIVSQPLPDVVEEGTVTTEETPSQLSRTRNESLKMSLNKALRDYEKLYGAEAAKMAFYQLTQGLGEEDPSAEQNDKQVEATPAAASPILDAEPAESSQSVAIPSTAAAATSTPRYLQYRSSLSRSQASSTANNVPKQDDVERDVENERTWGKPLAGALLAAGGVAGGVTAAVLLTNDNPPESVAAVTPVAPDANTPRYLQYRNSLSRSTGGGGGVVTTPLKQEVNSMPEVNVVTPAANAASAEESATTSSSASRYLSYRASLSGAVPQKTTAELLTLSDSIGQEASEPEELAKPRYLGYRSSLARSVAQAPSEKNQIQKEDSPITGEPVGAGAVSSALVESASLAEMNAESVEAVSAQTSGQRYMKYRDSLRQSQLARSPTTEAEEAGLRDSRNEDARSGVGVLAAAGVVAAGAVAATAVAGAGDNAESPISSYANYRQSLIKRASESVSALKKGGKPSDEFKERLNFQLSQGPKATSVLSSDVSPSAEARVEAPSGARTTATNIAAEVAGSKLFMSRKESNNPEAEYDDSDPYNDLEAGLAAGDQDRPELEKSNSLTSLDSTHYKRQRFLKYLALFFFLVAVPLGIGLGVSLGKKENAVVTRAPSQIPTSKPTPNLRPNGLPVLITLPTVPPSSRPTQVRRPNSMPVPASDAPPVPKPLSQPHAQNASSAPTPASSRSSSPSVSPSSSATLPFAQELLQLLSSVSFDEGASLQVNGTAQNRAYQWLVTNPVGSDQARIRWLVSNPTLSSDTNQARFIQRYAMATLFYSTNGENWTTNSGWLNSTDECSWFSRSDRSPVCDADGNLLVLDLGFNELSGTIPPEIALLQNLTRLGLSGGPSRKLSGTVPSQLGLLRKLSSLDLFGNAITGTIPAEMGNLESVETLNLSFNNFSGRFPSSLCQLLPLRELSLGINKLNGEIPTEIGYLSNIDQLSLNGNSFTGAFPSSIGRLMLLQDLNLEANQFISLPSEIGLLTDLQTLTLYNNEFVGPLFTEIGNLTNLRTVNLSNNDFDGSLPTEIGLLIQVRNMDFSLNNFTGSIPTQIGELTNLLTLQLQSNKLSGEVPSQLSNLARANTIRLDDNSLNGNVSDNICVSFNRSLPTFYVDCGGASPEISCPAGSCCTYCCQDGAGCECVYAGTTLDFLC